MSHIYLYHTSDLIDCNSGGRITTNRIRVPALELLSYVYAPVAMMHESASRESANVRNDIVGESLYEASDRAADYHRQRIQQRRDKLLVCLHDIQYYMYLFFYEFEYH